MSLLRQRATEVRVESTLRDLRPAFARARLVIATRSASDEELNEPASQAKVRLGAAKAAIEVTAKRSATARTSRRGEASRPEPGRRRVREPRNEGHVWCVLRGCPGVLWRPGHRRVGRRGCPRREGPEGLGSQVPASPVGSAAGLSGRVQSGVVRRWWSPRLALGPGFGRPRRSGDSSGASRYTRVARPPGSVDPPRTSTAVALAQWQSSGLWNRRLRVRAPQATPTPPAAIVLRRRPTARAMLAGHGPKDRSPRRSPDLRGSRAAEHGGRGDPGPDRLPARRHRAAARRRDRRIRSTSSSAARCTSSAPVDSSARCRPAASSARSPWSRARDRTATAICTTDCELLQFGSFEFGRVLATFPDVQARVDAAMARRPHPDEV